MNLNEPGNLIRYLLNRVKRIPTAAMSLIIERTCSEDMDIEEYNDYFLFRLKELYIQHLILALDADKKPVKEFRPENICYFADLSYEDVGAKQENEIKCNAAALYGLLAGDFMNISAIYNLEQPFQFLFIEGFPDASGDLPMLAYDIACIDPDSWEVSAEVCKRMWSSQVPSETKEMRTDSAVNKFMAQFGVKKDEELKQNDKAEESKETDKDDVDGIEHVALLMCDLEYYPKDIQDKLQQAGFNYVAYKVQKEDENGNLLPGKWEDVEWFPLI